MDMTKKWDNYIFNGSDITLAQNSVDLTAGANAVIVFKDGSTCKPCKNFPEGKTLKDIKYIAYSEGPTFVFIQPGIIDLTNLEIWS